MENGVEINSTQNQSMICSENKRRRPHVQNCRFGIHPDLRKIESDELIIYDVELPEYITRKCNRIRATSDKPVLTTAEVERIYQTIQAANITDPAASSAHEQKAKAAKARS